MNDFSIFQTIFKQFITEQDICNVLQQYNYVDTARKFKVNDLVDFFASSAILRWKSFRHGCDVLESVNFSTVSKKAKSIPFGVFKDLFLLALSRCNRKIRRTLHLPKPLLSVDSTTITFGENRLKWAVFHGKRSGIKLHIALKNSTQMPERVEETIALTHDSLMLEKLLDPDSILVADRAYFKIKRSDEFLVAKQSFVIRLKTNIETYRPKSLKRLPQEGSNVTADYTCLVGTEQNRSSYRQRIVEFTDYEGKNIRVITNLYSIDAETIAQIYKARWAIEAFFKWLKQQMNLATIFGNSPNAVYNQLYAVLLTYVILNGIYKVLSVCVKFKKLSLLQFTRNLFAKNLPLEWMYYLEEAINNFMVKYG